MVRSVPLHSREQSSKQSDWLHSSVTDHKTQMSEECRKLSWNFSFSLLPYETLIYYLFATSSPRSDA